MTVTQILTSNLADVGEALFNLLDRNKSRWGVLDVWYGDQTLYPQVPAIAVDPVATDRILAGSGLGGNTENSFGVYIYIYHGTLEDYQKSRRECDRMAANVEGCLHDNLQLDGLIIHGFVTKLESGQAERGSMLGVTRLTWEGLSKTLLGA